MEKQGNYIFNLTSRKVYRLIALVVFTISLAALLFLQNSYNNNTYGDKDLSRFLTVLHSKEQLVHDLFEEINNRFENEIPGDVLNSFSEDLKKLAEQKCIYFYYYHNGELVYWSDNEVPLRHLSSPRLKLPVFQSLNSIYVSSHRQMLEGTLYALIHIKTEYPYENDYLENGYQKDFKLVSEIELLRNPSQGFSDVMNLAGNYLFSLGLKGNLKMNPNQVTASLIIFSLLLIALFFFLCLRTDAANSRRESTIWFAISGIIMLLISFTVLKLQFPTIVFEAKFFKPDIFAGLYFQSLGHLWVTVLLFFMITLLIYWFFDRSKSIHGKMKIPLAYLFAVAAALWLVFFHFLGKSLVLDSTISFEAYKLNSLSEYTFIGLIIILMAFVIFCLLLDKAIMLLKLPLARKDFFLLSTLGIITMLPFFFSEEWSIEPLTLIFFVAIFASLLYLRTGKSKLNLSRFFVVILVFAVLTTYDLQEHTSEKLNAQKEIELAKLSSEHDAVAEMLFTELTEQLRTDSLLISRLSYQIIDIDLMFEYLQRTYFSGYWTKYDMQITLCRPQDSVFIEQAVPEWYPCYPFFTELVGTEGINIEESDFFFLNNLNGRISYLGSIEYNMSDDAITLFIELNSKIISEELGYPSLLMKEKEESSLPFSYAKYNKGQLITSGGLFNYRLSADYYTESQSTFENLKLENYNHTIFNVDPENIVIVSIPIVSFVDKLISFSYLFAFIFVIFAISYLLVSASHIRATVTWDFKNKIQYSVVGILFLTFLVICTGTIYFVIQQYKIKHQDNLENTMRSLYIELVHKVEFEEDLRNWSSESYYNLDELLRKFSNVFYTDINMFDEAGMLLATSRSEIFDQQLLSDRMNREAFEKLSKENYSSYIHTERIAKMTYQSAYVPLLNSENRFLAYLNLPYFTEPEILAQEVTNLVVAILNTYVILLLLILFLSVFLADRITQPLRFIQSRIAQLNLNKNNEKIVYKGRDEIAGLVDEYNYMVDELVKSAELLAQSEREFAWREMAKQIAHEIKNPLTPMKLNIQHMQRMITEKSDNIEEQVNKVSQTLIEQIDSLTSIANEFSDFAKMPKAKNKKLNIVVKLQNVVNLFENSEGVHIELDLGEFENIKTFGDPEQFQRVLINLVKNGIQSIPEKREKKIKISLEEAPENNMIISITDNGKGIPSSIQDKLFQPNFTTKSSGMGMGLAISASIIKTMNGNIWYSTKKDQGTTFFIKVPLV